MTSIPNQISRSPSHLWRSACGNFGTESAQLYSARIAMFISEFEFMHSLLEGIKPPLNFRQLQTYGINLSCSVALWRPRFKSRAFMRFNYIALFRNGPRRLKLFLLFSQRADKNKRDMLCLWRGHRDMSVDVIVGCLTHPGLAWRLMPFEDNSLLLEFFKAPRSPLRLRNVGLALCDGFSCPPSDEPESGPGSVSRTGSNVKDLLMDSCW